MHEARRRRRGVARTSGGDERGRTALRSAERAPAARRAPPRDGATSGRERHGRARDARAARRGCSSSPTKRPVSSSDATIRNGTAQGPSDHDEQRRGDEENEGVATRQSHRIGKRIGQRHGACTSNFRLMLVSEAVGRTLHRLGGDVVFGLMGSGNLAVTNAIVAAGGRFFSSRHETGAVCMADGYARVSGRLGVASRAPGAGADERDHRADRGGQEPHAADPAGGGHAGRAAALELQDRPGRARRVGRRGRRARARAGDRGRRHDARGAARGASSAARSC